MRTQRYSVSYTAAPAVFELANRYKFLMYKKHLNSYLHLYILELPLEDSVYKTHILTAHSESLTAI